MFITINELPVAAVPVGAAGENFLDFYLFLMIFNYFFVILERNGLFHRSGEFHRSVSFLLKPIESFRSVLEEERKWRTERCRAERKITGRG